MKIGSVFLGCVLFSGLVAGCGGSKATSSSTVAAGDSNSTSESGSADGEQSQNTDGAEYNESIRSEFINGCTESAGSGMTAVCQCVYNKIENTFPAEALLNDGISQEWIAENSSVFF